MKLDLNDLKPEEARFELSNGKKYTLKKFSLAAQIWVRNRFGVEKIAGIFENQSLPEISEIVFYLLKDKHGTLEDLQEAICTQQDRIELLTAMLKTIGISQPILDKLSGEAQSLSPLTGAQPTT